MKLTAWNILKPSRCYSRRSVPHPRTLGSIAGAADNWTRSTREPLRIDGILKIDGAELVFVKDHLFKTPGGAGAILVGRRTQGHEGWKNAEGLSINPIEIPALC
ncbi:DUF4357 domain-containing protein [Rhodococcus sp. IEGM 1379]|uniref:DUF4357 domain-containing protein n=1 Tax=Rhodococcus sp. IEGM 1379 TaxID=3047086 RepID=UPI0024B82D59|nr:DUF4357 domain-containing protein [Rhodococcus sp. IEGM 1379]MDI9918149.1 DUF4357 domain-containing protein [Rhodococcus sp. IEGM 1379]